MTKLIFLILSFLMVGCQTTKIPMELKHPTNYKPAKAKKITDASRNYFANYVKENSSLVLSRFEERTNKRQIYIKNLDTNKVRRITFERSNNLAAIYNPDSRLIFYTSEMDELKDNPYLSLTDNKALKPKTPHPIFETPEFGDIYSITLDHTVIKRRTSRPGFDGEIALHPDNKTMIFTHFTKDRKYRLQTLILKKNKRRDLTKGNSNQRMASYSKDGKKLIWVEYWPGQNTTQLVVANQDGQRQNTLKLPDAVYAHPSFLSPKEVLFTANLDDKNNFEIYSYNLETSCLKRLSFNGSQDLHPIYLDSSSEIMFISDRTGHSQVYLMNFNDYSTCPKSLSLNKIKQ